LISSGVLYLGFNFGYYLYYVIQEPYIYGFWYFMSYIPFLIVGVGIIEILKELKNYIIK